MTTNDPFLALLVNPPEYSGAPVTCQTSTGSGKPVCKPCGRCMGRGVIESFRHIKGGECFACEGTGDAGHFAARRVVYGADSVDAP